MLNLTDVLTSITLGLSAWTLLSVHGIKVRMAVHAEQREEHERRILKLEKRAGL